ncbi:aliphatic sulfonate ABC transporter permease SsuC, partial [Escherichia coli]|nr:aliphatic sulfonate ABC transporter permease SsuC [Escherichia coli]
MILSPVKSRKAKEHDDGNASEEVVIARCPLVFTGGHRGGVATGLLVGWLSTRILPSPEGVVTAFWTLSASGELW